MTTVDDIRRARKYSKYPKDFEDGLCPRCKGNLEPHLPCCMDMCIGKDSEIHPYESCEECHFTTWELRRGVVDFQSRMPRPLNQSQKSGDGSSAKGREPEAEHEVVVPKSVGEAKAGASNKEDW